MKSLRFLAFWAFEDAHFDRETVKLSSLRELKGSGRRTSSLRRRPCTITRVMRAGGGRHPQRNSNRSWANDMGYAETRGVRPFSKDRLLMVPRDEAAKCGFALLDKVQQEAPEIAMAGTVMLFATWCKRLKLDPHEMYLLGLKLVQPEAFHQKGNIHADVMRDFAGMRMMGDRSVDVR